MSQGTLTPADLGTPAAPEVVLPSDAPPVVETVIPSDGGAPTLLAGKYKDQDALIAGFNEQKALIDRQAEELGGLRKTNKQKADEQAEQNKSQGLDELSTALLDNGLAENEEITLKAQELGIDLRDIKLKAYDKRDNRDKAFTVAGGEETFTAIADWAKESLTAGELAQYNAGIASGNAFVIEAVKGRYDKAMATPADTSTMVTGDSVATASTTYANLAEYQADKRSAEFQNSSAVRKAVDEKFNRSFKAGKIS